jgi:hypothetical protein
MQSAHGLVLGGIGMTNKKIPSRPAEPDTLGFVEFTEFRRQISPGSQFSLGEDLPNDAPSIMAQAPEPSAPPRPVGSNKPSRS